MIAAHPLAHKDGIALVFGILIERGDMCPSCGFATRKMSARWAKCKKCGMRIYRGKISDVAAQPNEKS